VARVSYRDTPSASPQPHDAPSLARYFDDRPQLPYLIPLFAFLLVMAPPMLGHAGGIDWEHLWLTYRPGLYTLKTLLAAFLLWAFWNHYTRIRWTHLPLGILVGLVGTVAWIGIEYFDQHLGLSHAPDPASLYNPDRFLPVAWQRWLYLAIRVAGPTLVVPVMEELFFRDFLARMFIRGARFDDVPVGAFTWFSFLATAAAFAVNHGSQWPEGFVYGLLMGALLVRTKSLGACIVAHGTTNFTLYLYCIYSGDWQFM
jgi:CAAX prenyl protease-like protein